MGDSNRRSQTKTNNPGYRLDYKELSRTGSRTLKAVSTSALSTESDLLMQDSPLLSPSLTPVNENPVSSPTLEVTGLLESLSLSSIHPGVEADENLLSSRPAEVENEVFFRNNTVEVECQVMASEDTKTQNQNSICDRGY